jgi:peptide/nickel transport system substrate-binding protein
MSILPRMLRLAALALCFAATPAWAQSAPTTLRFIPQADLRSIDPIWTTAYVTRNFGYLVYDTLFALDKDFKPQPQMVDHWTVSGDKLTYSFTLREASNGTTGSRCGPPIASPRSSAGANATRSDKS